MKKIKALVLLSGGLDSMLAVKVLENQGIEVEALSFVSNFYGAEKAETAAKQLGIKLHIVDIKEAMICIVKNPASGHGKNLNPCIDCHAYMIRRAGDFLQKGFSFIATGEVLGQRPFSQNSQSLKMVRKLAGVEVLRPLSAKLLDETEIEKKGLVKREMLLDIEGRSRHVQMELATRYGIREYPSPAGGCLLTDPGFTARLRKMLEFCPTCSKDDIEMLKYGRIYWFTEENGNKVLVVVGRHKEDNEVLKKLVKKGDFMVELKNEMGPVTVVRIFTRQASTCNFQFLPVKRVHAISNELLKKIKIPEKLDSNILKSNIDKSSLDEIIKSTCLITGYYATRLRGKEVQVEIKLISSPNV